MERSLDGDDIALCGTWQVIVGGQVWGRAKVKRSGSWLFRILPDEQEQWYKRFTIRKGIFEAEGEGLFRAVLNQEETSVMDGILVWDMLLEDGNRMIAASEWQRFGASHKDGQLLSLVNIAREPSPELPLLPSFDLQGIAEHIRGRDVQRIVVLCGAGVSTSAGIPDYRTPGSGLFYKVEHLGIPRDRPGALFDLDYFRDNPQPFYNFCKNELFRRKAMPTPCHYFIRLLHEKGKLLRCYTQNIDNLESVVGLPKERLVAVHGCVEEAHVIDKHPTVPVDIGELKRAVGTETGWQELAKKKGGLVKPNIYFYGERWPARFLELCHQDLERCDLLIVMGTSLSAFPFRALVSECHGLVPRLLINREAVATYDVLDFGFRFPLSTSDGTNWRDVFFHGSCDDGCAQLAEALRWQDDLKHLLETKPHIRFFRSNHRDPACGRQVVEHNPSQEEPRLANHYGVLGISNLATPQRIREAFLETARTHHPDKGGSEALFLAARTAYEVLINRHTRALYDRKLLPESGTAPACAPLAMPHGTGHLYTRKRRGVTEYSARACWNGFFLEAPASKNLEEALRWYTIMTTLRTQAQDRMQQGSTKLLEVHEVQEAYALDPSLTDRMYFSCYVHIEGKKVYAPRVTVLEQALQFHKNFYQVLRLNIDAAAKRKRLEQMKLRFRQQSATERSRGDSMRRGSPELGNAVVPAERGGRLRKRPASLIAVSTKRLSQSDS